MEVLGEAGLPGAGRGFGFRCAAFFPQLPADDSLRPFYHHSHLSLALQHADTSLRGTTHSGNILLYTSFRIRVKK